MGVSGGSSEKVDHESPDDIPQLLGWRRQWHVWFNALVFFTRIPAPKGIQFNSQLLQESARYFPLVGALIAVLVWLAYALSVIYLPHSMAVLLALFSSLLITGAFHEDGLADCADAFGGGYDRERILTIMHDSRLGTYGVVALCGALGLKFLALLYILSLDFDALMTLMAVYSVSRWLAVVLMRYTPYVAFSEATKSKPMADQITDATLWVASGLAALFFVMTYFVSENVHFFGWLILLAVVYWSARTYFIRHIGGVNGDCLGATQQISELSLYLVVVASISAH